MKRERVPRKGVRILRDKFNVPHIYGKTHDDVTWGSGWVLAEDRGLLLEQARYNSRVAAIDAPGLSAIGLSSGLKTFKPSRQTERELAEEVDACSSTGTASADGSCSTTSGLRQGHQRTAAKSSSSEPAEALDAHSTSIALNAIKGQLFGQGGGEEVAGRTAPRRAPGRARRGQGHWS